MAKLKATTYDELRKLHGQFGTAGFKSRIKIGHNTWSRCHFDTSSQLPEFHITLHSSVIVKIRNPDNHISFTLAGWPTVTTRERINQFLPEGFHVSQSDGKQWFRTPQLTVQIDYNSWYNCEEYQIG